MANEVLSQNEIDSLLNALRTGDLDVSDMADPNEKQIKEYDFSRPSKFSKDHLKTLEIIFEHFSRLLSTTLPAYLRCQIQVEVVNSEAVRFVEFSGAMSTPVLLGMVDFYPLKGSGVLELSVNLGYTIIDRMLGGKGKSLEKNREFSEIETTILEKIFNVCVNQLREPWKNVVELEPRLEKLETNPQFAQIIDPNEMIALVTLNVRIGKEEGLMNICLPYILIESVMDKLNTKYWFSNMQHKDQQSYTDVIETVISKVKIPLRVNLGKSTISVGDFVNLQKGDIIRLDTKIDGELDVYVGNIKKFKGKPGHSKDYNALQVTSIVKEEEDI